MTQLDAKTEDNNMIDQGCEQKMNLKYFDLSNHIASESCLH